jgi:cytosolic iron-sulfur assembly component 3
MANFSGAVKLADLDDYLAPSQSCVKPMMSTSDAKSSSSSSSSNKGATIEVTMDWDDINTFGNSSGATGLSSSIGAEFGQIKESDSKTATVSLNDCLACSGCVTSAETVLITQQSTVEFMSNISTDTDTSTAKTVIITISPHARASLASKYDLSPLQTAKRLTTFFHQLGATHVLDASCASHIALMEAREEFIERMTCDEPQMPVIASECPGWICYAEKTQGANVLPLISKVRSPQQIMGAIVKRYIAKKLGKKPNEIYHVTVMPCYDKKLEGARNDFFDEEYETRDVDCVLTSSEVQQLLEERNTSLADMAETELEPEFHDVVNGQIAGVPEHGASGGYTENLFRYAATQLHQTEAKGALEFKTKRNADLQEISLEKDGQTVLKFAIAYGFRNIQNLMRKIKRKKCDYHYVEIMACPSGCLNGGGQITSGSKKRDEQKAYLKKLQETYAQRSERSVGDHSTVKMLYRDWIKGQPGSAAAQTMLHTDYHAVEKLETSNPLAIKW